MTSLAAIMTGDKFRFRFRKVGDLRMLSHLDLTRCVERMLRRARIPFASTQGFHPTPRMVFALAMPLGCEGLNEVLELELTEPRDDVEILNNLSSQSPRGLEFTDVKVIPKKTTAMPRRVTYTLPIPPDRVEDCQRIINATMIDSQLWVDRFKPKPRSINIRQYLRGLHLLAGRASDGNEINTPTLARPANTLTLDLWVTQTGTARADELLKHLEVSDLLDDGFVLSRSVLELHDETPAMPGDDNPPDTPPEIRPLNHIPVETGTDDEPSATWGLSPNGPVVE